MASEIAKDVVSHIISFYHPFALELPSETELEGSNRDDDRAKRDDIMNTAQMHLVVASLIMTVTFTAAFTLPGGVESDTDSPNKGMAILLRKTAFRAFVVSDTIAFTFSSGAVFAYFAMAANATLDARDLKTIVRNYNIAIMCQINAMAAVVVAFATGMYVTLEQSLGLAVTVCVICCLSFMENVVMFLSRGRT